MNWTDPNVNEFFLSWSCSRGHSAFRQRPWNVLWRKSVLLFVLWILYSPKLAFCFIEPPISCYIGLSDPKPDSKLYAEYDPDKDQSYEIEFNVDLCEDQKDVTSITLSVSQKTTPGRPSSGIPYLTEPPIPDMISIGYSSPVVDESLVHFLFIKEDTEAVVSYRYKLLIIFPKLTPSSSCEIVVEFSSKREGESYSATSQWTGSLIVQERAKIKTIPQHAVQQIVDQKLHNEIKCGQVMGSPKPMVVWSCQGNENFWIRKEKEGEKIPGPHEVVNLSLYEFGDDDNCIQEGRYSLTCTASNLLTIGGKPQSFSDSYEVDTKQIIIAVDADKASCQDATASEVKESKCKDFLRGTGRNINYNSTHKFQSFKNILAFDSYHKDVPSVCEKVMQNLVCNFFGSNCKKRGQELKCRSQCQNILKSCVHSPSLPKSFCNFFSIGTCDIDFTTGLTLLHNYTKVESTNNSAYIGDMSVAKNATCEDWNEVKLKPGVLFPSLFKKNNCRAIDAPENNNLVCKTKNSANDFSQCWPEPIGVKKDTPSIIHSCDVFCGIKKIFTPNLAPALGVLVFIVVSICTLLIIAYCCCCKKPSVRLVETDANNFPGIKLRQNPMYNGNSQSRVLPNTPDPSFGMGGSDVVRPNSRFPSVVPASRNRYVPTPENSLGRASGSSGHNFRYPQGVPGPRAHSPGIPVHASGMSRGAMPPGAAGLVAYGSGGRGGADPNPLCKFEYDRNKIQYIEDIGSGAFGYVFRAKAPGLLRGGPLREMQFQGASAEASQSGAGIEIAVKMLKDDATEEQMADFVNEAKLMSLFNHPNIIKLLGVCSVGKPFCLILEFMKNRDLSDFLRRNGPESDVDVKERVNLTTADLILICQQVASGMSYISEKNYIHRDLATRNCLVSESMAVKISDFGLSQYIGTREYLQVDDNDAIPIRWIAPEALHSNRFTNS